jgi:putative site-specific DNA-methyltransferase restriction-modification protein
MNEVNFKKNLDNKCQVFTPKDYVKELLDSVEYKEDILHKRILENSFGDGNILVEIVKRYIKNAKKLKYTNMQIKKMLENNIFGFEIDKYHFQKCIKKLNLITKKNEIENVKWNLYNDDFLRSQLNVRFDFIVGNPPYINYSDLPLKERSYIKDNFLSCKNGKFDYCYAFIEKSILSLTENGKMSYLIPSSIFKTVFGENLRNLMIHDMVKIKDYSMKKIFDNALIKSAIIILEKNNTNNEIIYLNMDTNIEFLIKKSILKNKWVFSNDFNIGKKRFGDFYKVSHVVATLLNKAYVIKDNIIEKNNDYYIIGDFKIEKELVRPTASPRSLHFSKKEKIIFPYKYIDNVIYRIDEDELKRKYPGIFSYLSQFKTELMFRKSDNKATWFEYGRSQALLSITCKKLLISTIVTDKISTYILEEECVPYGGMFISLKENNNRFDLNFAKRILESEEFLNYVKKIGINISGTSLRITSKDIENFYF